MKKLNITTADVENMGLSEAIAALKDYFGKSEGDIPLSGNSVKPTEKLAKNYLSVLVEAKLDFLKEIEETKPIKASRGKESKDAKRRRLIAEAKHKHNSIIRVIVTDNNPTNTLEDSDGVIEFKTYGNSFINFHTVKVLYDKPWMLPELMVETLEKTKYIPFSSSPETNGVNKGQPVARYNVQRLSIPTQDEIDAWKMSQQARAAIDS